MKELMRMMMGSYWRHQIQRAQAAWHVQDQNERRARIEIVVALSVELERIKTISSFSTLVFRGAIEAVIEGDWKHVADFAEWCLFGDEIPEIRDHYVPIWEGYRTILLAACAAERERRSGKPRLKN